MKLTYDPRYNIAYLRLHAKTAEVETIHVRDEIKVDLAPDGSVCGIELLNVNVQFARENAGQLVSTRRRPANGPGQTPDCLRSLILTDHSKLIVFKKPWKALTGKVRGWSRPVRQCQSNNEKP